jgi:hypothetical protein
MLEGPPSSMGNPLSVLYANMHFLEVIPCNVLSMSTFVSNRSLIGPCVHEISVHEFFEGYNRSLLPEVHASIIQVLLPESYPTWVSMAYHCPFNFHA